MHTDTPIAPADFTCTGYAVDNHVLTITLNRPERRNALNYRAYDELETAFRTASADTEMRCVVVTGADPAFCSGDDVGEIMAGPKAFSQSDAPPPGKSTSRRRPPWPRSNANAR